MLKVFFDTDNIGMITDMLNAEKHSHYPIQLFLSMGEPLKIAIAGKEVCAHCIAVGQNVRSGRMYRTPFQVKTRLIYPSLLKRHPIFPVR